MGRKKKYIEMFGSFMDPFNYLFQMTLSADQAFVASTTHSLNTLYPCNLQFLATKRL